MDPINYDEWDEHIGTPQQIDEFLGSRPLYHGTVHSWAGAVPPTADGRAAVGMQIYGPGLYTTTDINKAQNYASTGRYEKDVVNSRVYRTSVAPGTILDASSDTMPDGMMDIFREYHGDVDYPAPRSVQDLYGTIGAGGDDARSLATKARLSDHLRDSGYAGMALDRAGETVDEAKDVVLFNPEVHGFDELNLDLAPTGVSSTGGAKRADRFVKESRAVEPVKVDERSFDELMEESRAAKASAPVEIGDDIWGDEPVIAKTPAEEFPVGSSLTGKEGQKLTVTGHTESGRVLTELEGGGRKSFSVEDARARVPQEAGGVVDDGVWARAADWESAATPVPIGRSVTAKPDYVPGNEIYHGTPFAWEGDKPGKALVGNLGNDLYGPGLYLTDRPETAGEYAKKRLEPGMTTDSRSVYKTTLTGDENLFDLKHDPVPESIRGIWEKGGTTAPKSVEEMTGHELFLFSEQSTRQEMVEEFQRLGYQGTKSEMLNKSRHIPDQTHYTLFDPTQSEFEALDADLAPRPPVETTGKAVSRGAVETAADGTYLAPPQSAPERIWTPEPPKVTPAEVHVPKAAPAPTPKPLPPPPAPKAAPKVAAPLEKSTEDLIAKASKPAEKKIVTEASEMLSHVKPAHLGIAAGVVGGLALLTSFARKRKPQGTAAVSGGVPMEAPVAPQYASLGDQNRSRRYSQMANAQQRAGSFLNSGTSSARNGLAVRTRQF